MEKIEFYKNRTLSERFSVSVDFLKQNWKVLYKNVLIGALPLAIIAGFCAPYYQSASLGISSGAVPDNPGFMFLYLVAAMALGIYLAAMPGAILKRYGEGKLTPSTAWSDLSNSMFSLSGKTFIIGLLIGIITVFFIFLVGLILGFLGFFSAGAGTAGVIAIFGIIVFIMCAVLLVFLPSLSLVLFPAYFSGTGKRKSIKIAFGMGFRNWGNVFVSCLLAGVIIYVIMIIFSIPSIIVTMFSPGQITILTFIFSFLSALGTVLTYPIFFVFMAFQYFSIVESEQGLSLQSQVDEFENL